ncbi:MAG TPA: M48 family metallopeptidase [Telluria sp.]
MKYQPSLPEHNDNVSQEHPLKDFVVILGWLAVIAVLGFWLLGLAVDAMVDNMSHETEAKLYELMPAPAVAAQSDAPPQQAQLQAMVDRMRACAGVRVPARVALEKSEAPNAAVMPGGQIVVWSGLLDEVQSENGLAFVLAHELAHISHRDHLRGLGRSIVLFGVSAVLLGSDAGLTELLAPVGRLGDATYSRSREEAADVAALRTLNCVYGHAGGATEFFESMKGESGALTELSHYAASHPSMQARIDALNAAIRAAGMKVGETRALR